MRFITLLSIALAALTATAMPLAARADVDGLSQAQGTVSKDAGKVESTVNGAGKSVHGLRLRTPVNPGAGSIISEVKNDADKTVGGAGKVAQGHGNLPRRGGDGVVDKARGVAQGATGKAKGVAGGAAVGSTGKANGKNTLTGSV